MNKRYTTRTFGGASAIVDQHPDAHPCLFGFGWGNPQCTFQQHRETYTPEDAQAVCDYLNARYDELRKPAEVASGQDLDAFGAGCTPPCLRYQTTLGAEADDHYRERVLRALR